ncbi:hypothetical protein [Mesoterricola sediminis]|uniref:Uncharacterized protein n=1 Tax=Mesoterricola sediminis TaxID=2927980 RepID=A0AA48KBL1_9BACT|nr:hypothetical protein [Mesoterricola sediminis]BDU75951.1 hypothetical protein METESE_09090 [Mesoterricola sediminis]
MTTAAATALSSFSYLSALTSSGASSAVLGTLASAYTKASAAQDGSLEAVAGQGYLGTLASAIYTQSGSAGSIQNLSALTVGGLDSGSAASLLSGLTSDSASALQGFDASLLGGASLAAAGAEARKAYGSGTLTQAAQAAADTTSSPATLALQAVAASLGNTFTLLA